MQKSFRRRVDSLHEIFEFIGQFFAQKALPPEHLNAVELAVEEVFTNMVRHNAGRADGILLALQHRDGQLAVRLTDPDAEPFDINEAPEVRTDGPIEERTPGGLGIHLVRQVVDRIEYEHDGRRGTTTLFKSLG